MVGNEQFERINDGIAMCQSIPDTAFNDFTEGKTKNSGQNLAISLKSGN